jgi:hypothetical protein
LQVPIHRCEAISCGRNPLNGGLSFGSNLVYNSGTEVNWMRLLFRLLATLAVCVAALVIPAAPAQAQGPQIDYLSPSSGVPGQVLTVYGSNFTPGEYVDVYFDVDGDGSFTDDEWMNDGIVDPDGDFHVAFQVPETYKGLHSVEADGATSHYQDEANFTVKPGLAMDIDDGPVGTNVTVRGQGFAQDEESIELRYYLGTGYETVLQNIEADGNGSWGRTFPVPSSAQGAHRIDAAGASSAASAVRDTTFEVTPSITLAQPWGSPGQNLTMTGRGFYTNDRYIKILFEGDEAQTEIIRADVNGYWEGNFQVPELPIGTYSVSASGDFTTEEDVPPLSFEIRPGLVLSPSAGHVGTLLTVTGSGFPINEDVTVMYDGTQMGTADTGGQGTFQINFPVPESQHGQRTVTAEDDEDNEAAAFFTMESDAPGTPELESPAGGSRVGVIGKVVKPTFQWTAVSDQSGVYYSLQIATGDNLTANGLVDPVISVDNIVGTNYTLEKGLSYGSYYWVVQAVDGAGNKGQWSEVNSFHAGALPLWAFVLAIVVFVALVGTLVYYFVIRKRIYYY